MEPRTVDWRNLIANSSALTGIRGSAREILGSRFTSESMSRAVDGWERIPEEEQSAPTGWIPVSGEHSSRQEAGGIPVSGEPAGSSQGWVNQQSWRMSVVEQAVYAVAAEASGPAAPLPTPVDDALACMWI